MAEPNKGVVGERGPGSLRVLAPGVQGRRGDTTEAQVWTVEGRRAGMRSDQLATEEPLEIRLLTEERSCGRPRRSSARPEASTRPRSSTPKASCSHCERTWAATTP